MDEYIGFLVAQRPPAARNPRWIWPLAQQRSCGSSPLGRHLLVATHRMDPEFVAVHVLAHARCPPARDRLRPTHQLRRSGNPSHTRRNRIPRRVTSARNRSTARRQQLWWTITFRVPPWSAGDPGVIVGAAVGHFRARRPSPLRVDGHPAGSDSTMPMRCDKALVDRDIRSLAADAVHASRLQEAQFRCMAPPPKYRKQVPDAPRRSRSRRRAAKRKPTLVLTDGYDVVPEPRARAGERDSGSPAAAPVPFPGDTVLSPPRVPLADPNRNTFCATGV